MLVENYLTIKYFYIFALQINELQLTIQQSNSKLQIYKKYFLSTVSVWYFLVMS